MRVTQQAKVETRSRILEAAKRLFRSQGFEAARTKEIAHEAGIATGTLFNYFPTKEAVALALVEPAWRASDAAFAKRGESTESFEEDLFAYVAMGLRKLRPHRAYVAAILEHCLSPVVADAAVPAADSVRTRHLEVLSELALRWGFDEPLTALHCQMYWTLYTGVLAYWTRDKSPHQEDTLALLDQSLRMFVAWLGDPRRITSVNGERS